MMKTTFVFTGILFVLSGFLTKANHGILTDCANASCNEHSSLTKTSNSPDFSYSIFLKDSTDPNSGFKDLFEASAISTANSVRLNPRAIKFVEDYMNKQTTHLLKLKEWGRPYFNMMDGILRQHGLPVELKYLAVIESKLKSRATSWAGAVGPWQFMATTARGYGLKITKTRDDRTDYRKSTHAAAKYLKYLYNEFGDWLLVIAAYNGGPGVVYNAMKKSKSRNFWDLQYYLPAESRTHVKKFIGTHYIFEGQGGVTTLTKAEVSEQIGAFSNYLIARKITNEELNKAKTLSITGKYHSEVIAKHIFMDYADFNRYNPDFDKLMATEDNVYEIKLPPAKMDLFVANKYQILNESVNLLLNSETVGTATVSSQTVATQ
jgi:membrane-bound lytic murein transglycosylase D